MRIDSENPKELHEKRNAMVMAAEAQRSKFKTKDYFEYRVCPVCEDKKYADLFSADDGTYVKCMSCSMIYLNPVLNDFQLERYYTTNHPEQARSHPSEKDYYDRIYSMGLKSCMSIMNISSLLDVGCSDGAFLDLAHQSGIQTYGVEYNESEIELARSKSHSIWKGSVAAIPKNLSVDLITLWDVFEHIKDGFGFLTSLRTFLNPNGLFFLQIPNSSSLAARIMRDKCNMFDGMEHTNLYDPRTIRLLAERLNYEVISVDSIIDELAPLNNWLAYEDPYHGSFSNLADISWIDATRIHANLLGYKIQVILKPN